MSTDAHRSRAPRFGLTVGLPRSGEQFRTFARTVETAGFDVLTFADHLVPSAAPFSGAAAAAAVTERLHVGTLVLNNDFWCSGSATGRCSTSGPAGRRHCPTWRR